MLKKLKALWNGLPEGFKRVFHTFWQTFAATLLVSYAGVHDLSSAKAVVLAAAAAALAAVKALVVSRS